jgi:hypothetical protein
MHERFYYELNESNFLCSKELSGPGDFSYAKKAKINFLLKFYYNVGKNEFNHFFSNENIFCM